MYVAPGHRGGGLGDRAASPARGDRSRSGAVVATRLDTSDYLTPAVALYRAAGYREVPDYNGNPKANLWFERRSNVQD